ncbi:MAG TPA: flagellar motor protein MotB [Terracidiphilus sp.]|nr:flagellar motor protein MotB [Terracidiphilus sp.]
MPGKTQPIVIVRKKGGHGGHHGGAWKVAYADFVTAMMALFIVLWLMSSSEKVKKAVAGYFNDPKGTASQLGTTMASNGVETIQDATNLQRLKEKLEAEIRAKKELEKLAKQIEITITPEGLRIELLEAKNGTFYESGSAQLSPSGQELLALLAGELKTLPNNLLIEGHTDAAQYSTDANYSNWELSADRANAARRLLQSGGVREDQVTQVRGYADMMLRVKNNPYDPSNRRISILVKNMTSGSPQIADAETVGTTGTPVPSGDEPASQAEKPAAKTVPPAVKPSAASAAAQPAKTGLMGKLTAMLPGNKKG